MNLCMLVRKAVGMGHGDVDLGSKALVEALPDPKTSVLGGCTLSLKGHSRLLVGFGDAGTLGSQNILYFPRPLQ